MRGIQWSVKQSVATIVLFFALVVVGFLSYLEMSKQENPDIKFNGTHVTTVFPGAGSEEVERLVTNVLENELKSLPEIKDIQSHSLPNMSTLQIIFHENVELEQVFSKVREEVEKAKALLPKDVLDPEVNTELAETAFFVVHLSHPELFKESVVETKSELLKERLDRIKGIRRTEIIGLPEKEIHVTVDLEKLNQYKLSWEMIYHVLQKNDVTLQEGRVKIQDNKATVKTVSGLGNIDRIERIPLVIPGGKENIFLRDVATVAWGSETLNMEVFTEQQPSVSIVAYADYNTDARKLGDRVRNEINDWEKSIPNGYKAKVVFDQSKSVEQKFSQLYGELGLGMLIVILICVLGLAFRSAIITSLSIPITILISLFFLNIWGIGLHQITLASLILVLGILVDDAIVSNENIERHVNRPGEIETNIVNAVREVAPSITVATLTTIVGFAPLYFLRGDTGTFIQGIPQVVIVTLLVSLALSLYLVPALRKYFIARKTENLWSFKGWKRLQTVYQSALKKTLPFSWWVVGIAILLSTVLLGLVILLPVQFFPEAEGHDQLVVDIVTPSGSDLSQTKKVLKQIEEVIRKEDMISSHSAYIGRGLPRIYYNEGPPGMGESVGQVLLRLNSQESEDINALVGRLQEQFEQMEEARVLVRRFVQGPAVGAPIQIRITGDNLEELQKVSFEVKNEISKLDHIIQEQTSIGKPIPKVEITPKTKADLAGLLPHDISLINRFVLEGLQVGDVYIEGKTVPVVLRADQDQYQSLDQLKDLSILLQTPDGMQESGTLREVVEFSTVQTVPQITHYNGNRSVLITAYVDNHKLIAQVSKEVEKTIYSLSEKWPEGYKWESVGQEEERSDTFASMYKYFALSLFLIIILIYIQFQSFWKPIVVVMGVYMAAGGAMLGLFLTNQPFGFMALLGIIGLGGIVVRNGIMLIDFADNARDDGVSLKESLIQAGMIRLRPILLTTLTAVGGLAPLAIFGGELWKPLAVSIISGLLFSTFLTLFIIPALYYVISKRKKTQKMGIGM